LGFEDLTGSGLTSTLSER